MKDVQLWPRETDQRILTVFLFLAVSVIVGFVLPAPAPIEGVEFIGILITISVGVFVWGAFHLVRPARYCRKWAVAEPVVVPVVWILLMSVFAVWFAHLQADSNVSGMRSANIGLWKLLLR